MSSPPTPQDPIPQETPPPPPAPLPAPPVHTPSVNPRRLPPPCWSHDETVALIDAYRDKWYALRRGNLKATHWQEVADAVGRRCPAASPAKTAVQCRHKMEKLRKRYRTEIQRAKSMPLSRFSSSWVHFKRMDAMEKGPSVKADYNSDSGDDDDNDDEDDEDLNQDLYQDRSNFKNGVVNTRSVHNLYRNGVNSGPSSGGGSGFRIRIPTGVSIAQPGPKIYAKIGTNPNPSPNPNFNHKPNFGSASGSGSGPAVNYGTRVLRGCEDMGTGMGKREREPVVAEMVAAIKMLGDGFVKMEQMKMEMAREIETMRMEMEMKRTEMILDSQQRIVGRSDAAYEEAKRKERALQEEKLRQEKVKAEAEAKLRAEEAKRAALEAEKRAAKEAAEREAAENSKRITAGVSQDGACGRQPDDSSVIAGAQSRGSRSDGTKKLQSAVRATESALNIEQKRLQKLKELDEENQSLKLSSNEDFGGYEKDISRLIRQIRGLKDNVRTKASELVKILNNPLCPQSISLATFSKKVVSRCETPDDNVAMSCGYVIVLVASQVPQVMDILLGEFHRACIYTVPKHIVFSEAAFESEEAYYKTIGYREEDGKIESLENYLSRLKSYMRLYAALIQTEIPGVQNAHGLKEGWAWLARFLNALPANIYTGVALIAFLQLAGFALFKKYKSQFRKILDNIYDNFLNALKAREDSKLNLVIAEIQYYIEDKKFLEEPEGRTLQAPPLSSTLVPEADYQEYGRYHQYQEYGYQYH